MFGSINVKVKIINKDEKGQEMLDGINLTVNYINKNRNGKANG